MFFLIQNSQNRYPQTMQIKLDNRTRAISAAHVALLDLVDFSDAELAKIREDYDGLAAKAREALQRGKSDTDAPEIVDGRVV